MAVSDVDELAIADDADLGTRFRLFPQARYIPGYEEPEVIRLSPRAGSILSGPEDRRMYVVVPLGPKSPYLFPYLPPYTGDVAPGARPGPDGHFDHIPVGTAEFEAAHVYAATRRVLEIAESYSGREIPWHFGATYERLEIVPHLVWDNAQSGWGFLEMGEDDAQGHPEPFALNFDAVAHEIGHLLIFGAMGVPERDPRPDFFAYHEAAADFLSLVGLLHFDIALDNVLRRTRGNLLVANELDRFAELSPEKQIRSFANSLTVRDVGAEEHDRSRPFGGALFDATVEIYQTILFESGLSELDPRRYWNLRTEVSAEEIDRLTRIGAGAYSLEHFAFKSALTAARDVIGAAFIRSWGDLVPETLTFRDAALAIVERVADGRSPRFAESVADAFAWRGIL